MNQEIGHSSACTALLKQTSWWLKSQQQMSYQRILIHTLCSVYFLENLSNLLVAFVESNAC